MIAVTINYYIHPLWFYPWWVGNKGIVVQSASGWLSPTKLRLSWALRRPTKVCSQPKAVPYKMTRVYGPCPTWWAQPQFLQRGDFPTMFLVYGPSFSTIFMPFWGLYGTQHSLFCSGKTIPDLYTWRYVISPPSEKWGSMIDMRFHFSALIY